MKKFVWYFIESFVLIAGAIVLVFLPTFVYAFFADDIVAVNTFFGYNKAFVFFAFVAALFRFAINTFYKALEDENE